MISVPIDLLNDYLYLIDTVCHSHIHFICRYSYLVASNKDSVDDLIQTATN